jgi:glycyl-tRNA synthetase beta chain
MSTTTLLLELHCEEIPARFLKPLAQEMEDLLRRQISEWKVAEDLTVEKDFVSPRKLAWRLSGLLEGQPDLTETQVGPPERLCVAEDGTPTQTGLKFAEKWGVAFEAVAFGPAPGKKEPCATVTLAKAGRPTRELLAQALPRLISSLHVPKAMRWGSSDFQFVRPIRGILCLLGGPRGSEVVPFELDGVRSGATTWGHRLFHLDRPEPVRIDGPAAYEGALEAAGIVVSYEGRRLRLGAELVRLAGEAGGQVVEDAELLSTLAEIVEYPTIVRGEFPRSFLDLPEEVLITSLKEHQKAFCVRDAQGLLPCFLTAANRPLEPGSEAERLVAGGNEWVLKARLYDARFFFAEDRRQPLARRREKLASLTFHRELGSYLEKSERIAALARELAQRVGQDPAEALEAAQACKCDLVTLMVGEFPELQGVMGGEYLRREGAAPAVWQAVKEHYQPALADAPIPSTPMGCVLAVADKLDTVAGCFAIGLIPSGSKDPLALRRAGQGIVRILMERGWAVDPMDLCRLALDVLGARATRPRAETLEALESFFRDRVAFQLEQAGYPGPVRRSALPLGWTDLRSLQARCEALSAFADDPRFASLAQSAKRIGNILKDEAPAETFEAGLLVQAEEQVLAARLAHLEATGDPTRLLAALAELAGPLEAFFTAVMVKCEDPALRGARLSLLHRLQRTFLRVADFSLWQ